MTDNEQQQVRGHGCSAAQIAALCEYLSVALDGEPGNGTIGQAVEGLGALAQRLSDDLLRLADPNT